MADRYYKQQQDYLNSWNNQANAQSYGPAQGQNNYAYATGAYGPNGIRQTVGANPPNKVFSLFCLNSFIFHEFSRFLIDFSIPTDFLWIPQHFRSSSPYCQFVNFFVGYFTRSSYRISQTLTSAHALHPTTARPVDITAFHPAHFPVHRM